MKQFSQRSSPEYILIVVALILALAVVILNTPWSVLRELLEPFVRLD